MTAEQIEIVESAETELGNLHREVEQGGDSEQFRKKYNDIVLKVNSSLGGLFEKINDENDHYWDDKNPIDISKYTPCGITDRTPDYTPQDKIIGKGQIDDIVAEIRANPIDYGNLTPITEEFAPPGTESTGEVIKIRIPEIAGTPEWIDEIEVELKTFFQRKKTKSYYDPLDLSRGIPAKEREKKIMREKSAFILLDVSGSMSFYSYKGRNLMELFAAYVPPIANEFEGEFWTVDQGSPSKIIPLEDLRDSDIKTLTFKGGGGTSFDEAFRQLNEKKEEFRQEVPDADFLTVIFTDAEVYWDKNVMPDNLIIVTVKPKAVSLPNLDPEKNQKAIIIDT